jgi:D-glycero-alpha-D-manno-heptose-7-phosphate kinase
MIVVRAPLRISFAGGGTDLPDFYTRYPGRVLSTAIDKYVYVVVNRTPLIDKISARYSISETVNHPSELQHTRIKAALLDAGILSGIELASFASLPSKTGLGSSSAFSVALVKALSAYQGKKMSKREAAEAASRLEIELLGEPMGKQGQYAAAFGGINVLQFNTDNSVDVKPLLIDYKIRLGLEDHILLFFTGLARDGSSFLNEQKANVGKKFETLKVMSDSVLKAEECLTKADFQGLGNLLDQGWMMKKTLARDAPSDLIDALYGKGMAAGAWGGKVLGGGSGGCVMFFVPTEKKVAIRRAVAQVAEGAGLKEFKEIPVRFVQSGVEILHNSDHEGAIFV